MESKSKRAALVLVVDDDSDIRDAMAEVLADSGYRVLVAGDGQEALERARRANGQVCLILLDLMMPVMDGWHFREHQRADPALASIPVVILSAHGSLCSIDAVAHVRKPVQLAQLLDIVARFCGEPRA